MTIKHTVTFPDGTTATRTSKNRSYAFAVAISPETKTERLVWLNENLTRYAQDLFTYRRIVEYLVADGELVVEGDWLKKVVAVGLNGYAVGYGNDTRESIIENYRERIAGVRSAIAVTEALVVTTIAGTELVGPWRLSGWQSRADLASSELATQMRYHRGHEVLILTATQVVTGAK